MDIEKIDKILENLLKAVATAADQTYSVVPMLAPAFHNIGQAIHQAKEETTQAYFDEIISGQTDLARTQHFFANMSSSFDDIPGDFALKKRCLGDDEKTVFGTNADYVNSRLWPLLEQCRTYQLLNRHIGFHPNRCTIPIGLPAQKVQEAVLFKHDLRVNHISFSYSNYQPMVEGTVTYVPTGEVFNYPMDYLGVNYLVDALRSEIANDRYSVDFEALDAALTTEELNVFKYEYGTEDGELVTYHVAVNRGWVTETLDYGGQYAKSVRELSCVVVKQKGTKCDWDQTFDLSTENTPLWVFVIMALHLELPVRTGGTEWKSFETYRQSYIDMRLQRKETEQKAVVAFPIGTHWLQPGKLLFTLVKVLPEEGTNHRVALCLADAEGKFDTEDDVIYRWMTRDEFQALIRYKHLHGYKAIVSKDLIISITPEEGNADNV